MKGWTKNPEMLCSLNFTSASACNIAIIRCSCVFVRLTLLDETASSESLSKMRSCSVSSPQNVRHYDEGKSCSTTPAHHRKIMQFSVPTKTGQFNSGPRLSFIND